MQLSRYHHATPPVAVPGSDDAMRVVFATRTAEAFLLDDRSWRALLRGDLDAVEDDVLDELIRSEALVPDGEDELRTIAMRTSSALADNGNLSLVVQPTAACQLGCGYCGQEHSATQMAEHVQDALVEDVRDKLATGRFRSMHVSWFGAEPLLGRAAMARLSRLFIAAAADTGIEYRSTIVTNGVALSPEVAAELVGPLRIGSFCFTLDGPEEVHDGRRHWKNGRASFGAIHRNLVHLCQTHPQVEVSVRCNVDRSNADSVPDLYRRLAREGLAGKVAFNPAPVHAWGNDADKDALDPEVYAQLLVRWRNEMEVLGFPAPSLPGLRPIVCVAVNPTSQVADPAGTLFNCTEVPLVPGSTQVSDYEVGYLTDDARPDAVRDGRGRLHLRVRADATAATALRDFPSRVEAGELPCSTCNLLPVCGGGCPKAWHEDRLPCPPYRWNLDDLLLSALRQTNR